MTMTEEAYFAGLAAACFDPMYGNHHQWWRKCGFDGTTSWDPDLIQIYPTDESTYLITLHTGYPPHWGTHTSPLVRERAARIEPHLDRLATQRGFVRLIGPSPKHLIQWIWTRDAHA